MDSGFHMLCPRYNGSTTPTAPTVSLQAIGKIYFSMEFMDKIHLIFIPVNLHLHFSIVSRLWGQWGSEAHCISKAQPTSLLLLPNSFLIQNRYPFTAGLTEIPSHWMAKPGFEVTTLPSAP